MLGLPRGAVQLVPYTPAWIDHFQIERDRLRQALGADALDIQHIGSTAIPELAAKPILDLAIAVASETMVAACVPRLAALGYTYRGYRGSAQGHFFDQGSEACLTHYLHMLLIEEPAWSNYLQFRDYLRRHVAARDAYEKLKQELSIQYATDRAAYSAAKGSFIQHILAMAQDVTVE
jgi:GrpB-like predicted nucleotidyltransferase (UPF0157 family)